MEFQTIHKRSNWGKVAKFATVQNDVLKSGKIRILPESLTCDGGNKMAPLPIMDD